MLQRLEVECASLRQSYSAGGRSTTPDGTSTRPASSSMSAVTGRRASLTRPDLALHPGHAVGAGGSASEPSSPTGEDGGPGAYFGHGEVDTRGSTYGLSIRERRALFERDQTKR